MRLRCAASLCGGLLLPVYYFMLSTVGPSRGNSQRLIPKNPLTCRGRTIVFETHAYISYNLKFVY
jgi:hypothetical protein